jgi:hypothetical protein
MVAMAPEPMTSIELESAAKITLVLIDPLPSAPLG